MNDDIKTNFDSVITTDPEYVYEDQIEFQLDDFVSLIYSITNSQWIVWYIDDDGEEYEEIYNMEAYKALESLVIKGIVIDKEKLLEFLGIIILKIGE